MNKSEQRHTLAQAVFTFKQGRVANGGHEEQQFRALRLNLVIAAIIYWSSTYIADAVAHLPARGHAAQDGLLAHAPPLIWEHIGFSGDFLWKRATAGRSAKVAAGWLHDLRSGAVDPSRCPSDN